MKILLLSQHFWPESFRVNELVVALAAKGVEVEVLTGKPNYPGGVIFDGYRNWGCLRDNFHGMNVYRVPLMPRGKGALRLGFNYLSFIFFALICSPWMLKARRFDAIFVFGTSPILQAIPAIWLGWIKKCPIILWVQDLWPESLAATGYVKNTKVLSLVKYLVSWIYQNVDLLLVQSPLFISRVQALAGITPIAYYPNSFFENNLSGGCQNHDFVGFNCKFPVLFAGNLGKAQALNVIINGASLIRNEKDIKIIIVGDGSCREWMMQKVVDENLNNIVFLGSYPVEVMPTLMSQAAALLVTLADTEILHMTVPSKVQAYLAAGRPIIASLNGAGAKIIREALAGIAVPAEDPNMLAEAIMTLYHMSPDERANMGDRGRRYYEENFSPEKLVDELIEHFKCVQLLNSGCKK